MSICPKCKQDIHSLIKTTRTLRVENLTVKEGHRLLEPIRLEQNEIIECPSCGWKIADTPEGALDFLQGR